MRHTKPMQPRLRLRDRRRRMMWVKVAAGSAVAALVVAALFYVSRIPDITITRVEVEGARIVSAEDVQKFTENKLSGNYGVLIPRANVFFAPRDEIRKTILATYPQVKSVALSEKNLTTLAVSLTERTPAALWCGKDTVAGADCYAMDENGFIFMKMPSTDGYVRYFGAVPEEPIGGVFLSGDFKTLHDFVMKTVSAVNRAADSVTIADNNDVTLALVGGGELRFVRTDDTSATLENIASVFASQSFKTKKNFEYADFRYGSKVYVKFTGDAGVDK